MPDLDETLRSLKPAEQPTLKDRIRERLPAIEAARANGVPWKVIINTLAKAGVEIEPQLLANYVCQLRKAMRPPKAPEHAGNVPVKPTPPPPEARAMPEQVRDGDGELVRRIAGNLLAPPLLQ